MIGTNSMEDKKMKKITFAILAIAFIAAFNSCKEEEEIQTPEEDDWEYFAQQYDKDTPRTPGSFVMFGANTYYNTGVAETRTAYSDAEFTVGESTKERIDWVEGDNIQVFCNQSSAAMDAVYSIYDHQVGENPVQSVAPVHLVSAQGLKWGTTDPHIFHGIYPKENTIALNSTVSPQYPKVTNRDETTNGYTGTSLKFITCVPAQQPYPVDMNLAGMVATTIAPLSDRGNVTMVFYPIVTTLQFDLKNVSKRDITINEIFIDGADVAGKYDVEVKDTDQVLFDIDEDSQHQASVYGINKTLATGSDETVRVVLFALPMEFTHAKLGIKMTIDGLEVTRKVALNYKEEVTVNGETTIVKKDIVFQPTHKYNFTIEIPESIVFEVNPPKYEYDVNGGTDMITITSYTYNALGEKTPVAWTATEYSIDGGETWDDFDSSILEPDELGLRPTLLQGWGVFNTVDVPAEERQLVTPLGEVVYPNKPPYRTLKQNTKDHPAVNVDLSMRDVNGNPTSLRNTANCYMVHAGGTYRFPIVYGNAIKNGATNTIAFNPTMDRTAAEIQDSITYSPYKKTGADGRWITLPDEPYYSLTDETSREAYFSTTLSTEDKNKLFNVGWGKGWTMENNPAKNHFLSPLLNHTGNGITDPWLKNNTGVNPTTATLLWQDAKNLIKNVGIEGDYVTFEVTSVMSELVEGNALIAVTDGTNILWSWHIWVTEVTEDQNINSSDAAYGGVYEGQTMASTLIGKKVVPNSLPNVTDAKIATFLGLCDLSVSPKEIKVKFVQEGTNSEAIVTLTEKGLFDMNAPFYQYGRKDPLRFQKGINGADRSVFKDLYDIGNVSLPTSSFTTFTTSPFESAVFEGIKRPLGQCKNNGLDEQYYNLWAARLTRPGRYDAVRADKTKTVYDPCPAGYRVPALADVAGWAGNNNSDGYQPNNGATRYYRGRVTTGWSETRPYAILAIDGENKNVYVPFFQGAAVAESWTTARLAGSWRLTETASWVSTPTNFSCVQSAFEDTDGGTTISYPSYNSGQMRRTEAFYWYYARHATNGYYQKVGPRWAIADQSIHQIRFGSNVWMNEPGANRNNSVNLFMVKERDTDTSLDNYQQETQN